MDFKSILCVAVALYLGTVSLLGCQATKGGPVVDVPATQPALFTLEGTDPTFQQLKDEKQFPIGENSTGGVKGSLIRVKRDGVDKLPTAKNAIPKDISIHTLCNAKIDRPDFAKWTRWYQEDGNTQVFRLFKGETNVRNDRQFAARIEAFSSGLLWTKKQGQWHEWEGTYTIVKPHPSIIFQVKNLKNDWAVILRMEGNGDINVVNRQPSVTKLVAKNMTGKSFVLRVRDNGEDFEVFVDGEKVSSGSYERPEGTTAFRWGIYRGGLAVTREAMIFVTGATFK